MHDRQHNDDRLLDAHRRNALFYSERKWESASKSYAKLRGAGNNRQPGTDCIANRTEYLGGQQDDDDNTNR